MSFTYKRVLIKISGEALAGAKGSGFDMDFITELCKTLKSCLDEGMQAGIVIGGGNFWRGVKDGAGKIERVSADRMGMLATCMNCLAVADVYRRLGGKARVMTAFDIQGVGERFDALKSIEYMEKGELVLFGGGSGCPFFSTDTAAVLRAGEIHADAILLAKNVDGVYSADPKLDPSAVRFDRISYDEVLSRHLKVMDSTATSLAMENEMPVIVFALDPPRHIRQVLEGQDLGTRVE